MSNQCPEWTPMKGEGDGASSMRCTLDVGHTGPHKDWHGVEFAEPMSEQRDGLGALRVREALEAVIEKGCSCHSTTEADWHGPKCPIPKVRAALASQEPPAAPVTPKTMAFATLLDSALSIAIGIFTYAEHQADCNKKYATETHCPCGLLDRIAEWDKLKKRCQEEWNKLPAPAGAASEAVGRLDLERVTLIIKRNWVKRHGETCSCTIGYEQITKELNALAATESTRKVGP